MAAAVAELVAAAVAAVAAVAVDPAAEAYLGSGGSADISRIFATAASYSTSFSMPFSFSAATLSSCPAMSTGAAAAGRGTATAVGRVAEPMPTETDIDFDALAIAAILIVMTCRHAALRCFLSGPLLLPCSRPVFFVIVAEAFALVGVALPPLQRARVGRHRLLLCWVPPIHSFGDAGRGE